jgi:hypothetical protein
MRSRTERTAASTGVHGSKSRWALAASLCAGDLDVEHAQMCGPDLGRAQRAIAHLVIEPLLPSPAARAPSGNSPRKLPRVHRISRQELYNLIWFKPITALAERFGISDRGLAKVCRRSGIPAPPPGYWAVTGVEPVQFPLADGVLTRQNCTP